MSDHTIQTKWNSAIIVTRKFRYQCFGGTLTWLMEGFVTLLEAYGIDKVVVSYIFIILVYYILTQVKEIFVDIVTT